jgi:hypothetical protein
MTRLEKDLLSRSLSCTTVAWTLGHALVATRSNGERAHRRRRRPSTGWVVKVGALARWWWILRQKKHTGVRSIYAKRVGNGRANRRLAGGEWAVVLTLARGKKWWKGEIFALVGCSYRRRRERVWAGPSSRRRMSVPSQNRRQAVRTRVPYSRWLTGGPRLVFSK